MSTTPNLDVRHILRDFCAWALSLEARMNAIDELLGVAPAPEQAHMPMPAAPPADPAEPEITQQQLGALATLHDQLGDRLPVDFSKPIPKKVGEDLIKRGQRLLDQDRRAARKAR